LDHITYESDIRPGTLAQPVSPHLLKDLSISGILIFAFVAMRVWRLTAFSLDGDEIFSLLLAREPWSTLFGGAIQDAIHPPLFYALLRVWILTGGESLLWIRLLPAAISAVSLAPFFLLCRDLKLSGFARNVALGFAAFSPFAIFYSQHLRMYSLLMLTGLTSVWAFEHWRHEPVRRRLVILCVADCVLVYTHYYGWLIVVLQFVYTCWKQRELLLPFLRNTAVVGILFSPWAWKVGKVFYSRGLEQNLGWIPKPSLRDFLWFFADLTGIAELPLVGRTAIALVVIGVAVIAQRQHAIRTRLLWPSIVWILPAGIAFLMSRLLPQSVSGDRHLVFTIWPFAVSFADSLSLLSRTSRRVSLALLVGWAALAIRFHSQDDRKLPFDSLTISLLERTTSDNMTAVYTLGPYLHYPLSFYIDCLRWGNFGPFGPHLPSSHDLKQLSTRAMRFQIFPNSTVGSIQWAGGLWIGYENGQAGPPSYNREAAHRLAVEHGCQTGIELSGRDRFRSVALLPVNCPTSAGLRAGQRHELD
jgi:hypothetical protein